MTDHPGGLVVEEHFDGPDLDPALWLPHYLPAWSSRELTRASYELRDSCLHLRIPPTQGLWCADDHRPPMRVSGVQSGSWSGPVGETRGQQPYRDGLVVREAQETFRGWTPSGGRIELRARAVLSPRSMVAFWLVGLEDEPSRCAEICVMEIFGDAVRPGSAEVGVGLHAFRDPDVVEDWAAVRLPIDPAQFHTYTVDWTVDRAQLLVDGVVARTCARPPTYPMQLMLAVFDFPERSVGDDADAVPELVVDSLRGYACG
ncbi:glycoside hydrolase family 16 protein [Cellulomonas sp. ICMP 17802]|uniref:glycoside hydrolase family 16 protein n=1 Tax=Cellulomonas sp. ICMP 17802 TaxID=3239199 RepID=UPI00351B8CDC